MAVGLIAFMVAVIVALTNASIFINGDAIVDAYQQVRNDTDDTPTWLALEYDGKQIKLAKTGTDYADFLDLLQDDSRVYGYVRMETGDEMSRRAKYAFIVWIGPAVSQLKAAKVSTDKRSVKDLMPQFAKEILADEKNELKYDKVYKVLEAASGAAYGTGRRRIESLSLAMKIGDLADEFIEQEEAALKETLITRMLEELEMEN